MRPILQAISDIPLQFSLQRRETLLLRGSGRLHCEAGEVWLTESDSSTDAILVAGDEWPLRPGFDVVLSAPGGARVSVSGGQGAAV